MRVAAMACVERGHTNEHGEGLEVGGDKLAGG
jgi:hypothetical protein